MIYSFSRFEIEGLCSVTLPAFLVTTFDVRKSPFGTPNPLIVSRIADATILLIGVNLLWQRDPPCI